MQNWNISKQIEIQEFLQTKEEYSSMSNEKQDQTTEAIAVHEIRGKKNLTLLRALHTT